MQTHDQAVVKQFQEAMRLSHLCLVKGPGLPEHSDVHHLAYAILSAGVAKGGDGKYILDRAGAEPSARAARGNLPGGNR
jgi:hypothetical protein